MAVKGELHRPLVLSMEHDSVPMQTTSAVQDTAKVHLGVYQEGLGVWKTTCGRVHLCKGMGQKSILEGPSPFFPHYIQQRGSGAKLWFPTESMKKDHS